VEEDFLGTGLRNSPIPRNIESSRSQTLEIPSDLGFEGTKLPVCLLEEEEEHRLEAVPAAVLGRPVAVAVPVEVAIPVQLLAILVELEVETAVPLSSAFQVSALRVLLHI
jgi:virulence-associated protein VagC